MMRIDYCTHRCRCKSKVHKNGISARHVDGYFAIVVFADTHGTRAQILSLKLIFLSFLNAFGFRLSNSRNGYHLPKRNSFISRYTIYRIIGDLFGFQEPLHRNTDQFSVSRQKMNSFNNYYCFKRQTFCHSTRIRLTKYFLKIGSYVARKILSRATDFRRTAEFRK